MLLMKFALVAGLIATCDAQYGQVAPPAPIPPTNYVSYVPVEAVSSSKASNPQINFGRIPEHPVRQKIRPQATAKPFEQPLQPITCVTSGLSKGTQLLVKELEPQSPHNLPKLPQPSAPKTSLLPEVKSTSKPRLVISISTTQKQKVPLYLPPASRSFPLIPQRITTPQAPKLQPVVSSNQLKQPLPTIFASGQGRPATRLPPHTPITVSAQSIRVNPGGSQSQPVAQGFQVASSVEHFRYTDCITDTLFVIDSTSSVRHYFDDHLEYVLEAIKLLLSDDYNDEQMIGIIEYSSSLRRQIKLPFGLHKNRTEVINLVKGLPFFAGITATGAALKLALKALEKRRPEVPTNVVVITDGFSYDLVEEPAAMLRKLRNVRTFAATVTDSWRQYELEVIAGDPRRVYKGKESVRELVKALTSCNDGPRRDSSPRKKAPTK